jgi:hypothetical protein
MVAEILSDEWSVVDRLTGLGLERDDLIDVVRACAAAYGGCTDNDPPAARGWETWRMGVRALREVLRPKGWEKSDAGGFSTIVNHALRIRIAVTSTDDITGVIRGDLAPANRLPKGSTAERATAINQIVEQLPLALPGAAPLAPDPESEDYQTWHFCIYIKGDIVRAELSRYNGCADGFLTDCRERIFIVGDGDWIAPDLGRDSDPGPEFDFEIQRKQ